MSCDFKPGDEVVCVSDDWHDGVRPIREPGDPRKGDHLVVATVTDEGWDGFFLNFPGCPARIGYSAPNFRKIQKRNVGLTIEAFLTIKPGQFEEPRCPKAPAKKRERA